MSQQLRAKVKEKGKYSFSSVETAVSMVKSKQMFLRMAATSYGVPKSTLHDKIKENTPMTPQPRTVLSTAGETRLVDWVTEMANIGYGRTKPELLNTVKTILDKDGRSTPFKDNKPGKDWYYGFLKRHPQLSNRTTMQLSKERAVISPQRITKWFEDFKSFMDDEISDETIFKDPSRWYNADESGFPHCPKSGKVLALRGQKNVYNFSASDKTQITVLCGMSATGHYIKPMIVFPGQRFSYDPLQGFEDGGAFGRSDSGWMDTELFTTWLRDVFLPGIKERGVKTPIILFVDGHVTHLSMEVSTLCKENDVILYCLLEHASHLMQPCDLTLFSSLKETWKQAVREFQVENIGEVVTKAKFASVFKKAYEKSANIENAVKGFRDAGLFPLDVTRVTSTIKMEPSKVFVSPSPAEESVTMDQGIPEPTPTLVQPFDPHGYALPLPLSTPEPANVLQPIDLNTVLVQNEPLSTSEPLPIMPFDVNTVFVPVLDTASASDTLPVPDVALEVSVVTECTPTVSSPSTVSPAFNEVLKLPTVQRKKSSTKREPLPKAITGDKFRQILNDRKRKKEEEEAAKIERKRLREEKKKEKELEKLRKQEERERKKKENATKKKEKERARIQKSKRSQANRQMEMDAESSDNEEVPADVNDDDADDVLPNIDRNSCYRCEQPYDNNLAAWIGCNRCPRLMHSLCHIN